MENVALLIKESLINIGYDPKSIEEDYTYTAFSGIKSHKKSAKIVAFSDAYKKNIDTCCIAFNYLCNSESKKNQLQELSYLGAPIISLISTDSIEFYTGSLENINEFSIKIVETNRLQDFLTNNRLDFLPENILSKKGYKQLSIFNYNQEFKAYAKNITKKILNKKVEEAVYNTNLLNSNLSKTQIGKIIISLLSALILNDKGYLGDNNNLYQLMESSKTKYSSYFSNISFGPIEYDLLNEIYYDLTEDITYNGLTDDMLGYFYESFFVSNKLRKELGIHYTPPAISTEIVNKLPFEDIPNEYKFILDGTCGHGSLLLASYERLSNMILGDNKQKIKFIKERLIGFEKETISAYIAKLSFLLYSLDSENSWKIEGGKDFLDIDISNYGYPSIIVGNPPFMETRNTTKEQYASKFVDKYIDILKPDGLMGIILPDTFLENSSCKESRYKLIENCEVLEIMHLPQNSFDRSNVSTIALLLRKRKSKLYNTIITYVKREGWNNFKENNQPSYTSIVPAINIWSQDQELKMNTPFNYKLWDYIKNLPRLGNCCKVKNGIQYKDYKNNTHCLHNDYIHGYKKWLHTSEVISPYHISWNDQKYPKYIDYSQPMYRKKEDLAFFLEQPKIIMNSKYNPDYYWRIFACLDMEHLYPNETCHVAFLETFDIITLKKIEMILNSYISNFWIYTFSRTLTISPEIIESIPCAEFSNDQFSECLNLSENIKNIISMKDEKLNDQLEFYFKSLDNIILDCYKIDSKTRDKIFEWYEGSKRKGFNSKDIKVNQKKDFEVYPISGIVNSVDPYNEIINITINGLGSYNLNPNNFKSLPGWMLNNDTVFKGKALLDSNNLVELSDLKQIGYSKTSFSDIFNKLDNMLTNKYRGC